MILSGGVIVVVPANEARDTDLDRGRRGITVVARNRADIGEGVGDVAGLLLILLGGAMMVVATMRFRQVAKDIDAADLRPGRGTRMDVTLVMLLLALGGTLFAFLIYTVVRRMG